VVLVLLALGSFAITAASVVYFNRDELAPFVIEKLPLPLEDVWQFALKVHVVAAALALPGCLLLQSRRLLRAAPRVHRWLGRPLAVVILFALAPSGFYLSLFAKGGLPATLGFMLSGVIVVVAMVQAVRSARSRNYVDHRRSALHVLAQLSVAVTSRAMIVAADAVNANPDVAYLVSLWLPVLGSALVVELIAPRVRPLFNLRRKYEALTNLRPA
jgi:hypothetical protein